MKKTTRRLVFLCLACVLGLGLDAFWIDPSRLVLRSQTLALGSPWPASMPPLRIAVLGDLHVGAPYYGLEKLRQVVEKTNAVRPDLVVLLGDYVIQGVSGGKFVSPEDIAEVLKGLRADLGVYAVLGNHDWWLDGPRIKKAFETAGIKVLEDEARRLSKGGAVFWLAGVSDFTERPHDIGRALASVPLHEPVLVMTHNPDLFPEVPERVCLTLAAHTHGGQVNLPFLGTPLVPSIYGSRYVKGLVVEGGKKLFVTSGLGTSILPVRFRVRPEIVLLTVGAGA